MGLRIATNTQAIAGQRNLAINNRNQQTSIEKLASGTRIVRAADDAAGLAISEKMRGQIRSVRQDVRNAQDGISMVQTTEGALNEVGNILIRFRELSIQAASDTIGDTERGFVDKEVQELRAEIDRIAASTEYNGTKVLTGEGEVLDIQVGQSNAETDRVQFDVASINATAEALGVADISVATKEEAQNNLEKVDSAIGALVGNRATLGAMQNKLQSTINNLQIYDENLSAARSRIYDVDMATETSELVKQNILTSATVSVLGQANTNPQLALKLLS